MLAGRTGSSLATRLDLKLPRRGERRDEAGRNETRRGQARPQRGGKKQFEKGPGIEPLGAGAGAAI
jgi:hypothetical protein